MIPKNKHLGRLLIVAGVVIAALGVNYYYTHIDEQVATNKQAAQQVKVTNVNSSIAPAHSIERIAGNTMGTTYHISYFADEIPGLTPQEVKAKLDDFLISFNQEFSTYIPTSTVSEFNKFDKVGVPFPITASFAHLVQTSQEVANLSQGYYDITIYPLVKAWGFGPGKPIPNFTPAEVAQFKAHVGMNKFSLSKNAEGYYLEKKDPQVQLDFSSIAKGYGVDMVGAELAKLGAHNYLVEIGGEVTAKGVNDQGKPWTIAIEQPTYDGSEQVSTIIGIKDLAVATSGNYRNFRLVDGHRLTHEINPFTGYPIKHNTASLTVIAANDKLADALSTALYVMGSKKALALANEHNIAIFVIDFEDGKFVTKQSNAFAKAVTVISEPKNDSK